MSTLRIKASGITWVVGNVKHPRSVCLKGIGVNSIRCTQCIQWFMQDAAEYKAL